METSLIFTSKAQYLASKLTAKAKDADFIFLAKNKDGKRFFPDGEIYARIPEIGGLSKKRVIVLHSGSPKPNDGLVELELVLQILKDHGIKPEVFFTYFAYSRQDKIFENGETNAAERLIQKIINYYEAKKIYIVDPHFGKMPWLKKYPVISICSAPLLMRKMKENSNQDVMFVSPDKGGKRRTGISGLDKKRTDTFNVDFSGTMSAFDGKVVGVIDDILATGGTLAKFYDYAEKSGAQKVIAMVTHGPFRPGIIRIKDKFPEFYLTNTINAKEANVDITDLIVKAIQK